MMPSRSSAPLSESANSGWRTYFPNALIMVGAFLVSVQFALRVLVTEAPVAFANAQPAIAFGLIAVTAVFGRLIFGTLVRNAGPARTQFGALLLALAATCAGLLVLVPAMPAAQIAVFAVAGVLLGGGVILLRARLIRGRQRPDLITSARDLWRRRDLIQLWVTNNLRARYSQAVLGIIWVVLLPLAQAIIMAFVFSQFLRIPVGDVPFISFYMAALVPWGFLNNSVVQGAVSTVNNMELINQVYFPREILPLVKLGETAADALFTFVALVAINLVLGIPPNIYWLYLPLLAVILFAGTFGLSLFLSVFTIYVRDVPQLAFVIMQLVFYLSPILYPVEMIPERLRFVVMLNPLVPIIQGFRDVLVFGRPVDIVSLYYPIVFAASLLYVGYTYFKAYERRFTDYI